jgi:hypothetical protein
MENLKELIDLIKISSVWYNEAAEDILDKYDYDTTKISDVEKMELKYLNVLIDEMDNISAELDIIKENLQI